MMVAWGTLAQNVYYIGVGCLLIATSIRFMYRFIRDIEKKHDFVDELQHDFPKIKHALIRIGQKLNLDITFYDEDDDKN